MTDARVANNARTSWKRILIDYSLKEENETEERRKGGSAKERGSLSLDKRLLYISKGALFDGLHISGPLVPSF